MTKVKKRYYRNRVSYKFKKFLEGEPEHLIGIDESQWIKYVKKTLHSIWSLNDDGSIYLNYRKNSVVRSDEQDMLVNYLVEDISSFKISYEFKSNAAYIWEILRNITVARIRKDAVFLISYAEKLESIESHSLFTFNKHVKSLVIAAKVECYIAVYFLIKQNSTTEAIVGYKIETISTKSQNAYDELIDLVNFLSEKKSPPDYYNFPHNTHLIERALSLVENTFVSENDESNSSPLDASHKDESFVGNGPNCVKRIFNNSFRLSHAS